MNCFGLGCIFSTQHGQPFKPGRKITINEEDGEPQVYDFLVIACDPQDGLPEEVMKKTDTEKKIFSPVSMKSFTFQTTLMKFPKVVDSESQTNPVEVFNPVNLNKSEGLLHSYRSETRKEAYQQTVRETELGKSPTDPNIIYQDKLSKVSHEYVTCYQLVGSEEGGKTQEQLWDLLQEQMRDEKNKEWFPYDASKGSKIEQFHTKYFNHFTIESLKNGPNNWDILENQGKKNTIYVHASTAFESVLHIYNYIELLHQTCHQSFPDDKSSKIAVVGAGPSGLLISRKLKSMGYTDITVYETKANSNGPDAYYAGKTQTNMIEQSELSYVIPAELGTCYLSPSYQHMYNDFKKTGLLGPDGDENELISLDQIEKGPFVKSIITDQQFDNDGPVKTLFREYPETLDIGGHDGKFPPIMDFEKYQIVKGFEEVYKGGGLSAEELKKLFPCFLKRFACDASEYIKYHIKHFGVRTPFPSTKGRVQNDIFSTNIYDFLKDNGFISLLGLMQFGYSLQGYGSTGQGTTISAFYFMMWVTPHTFFTFILNKGHNEVKQFVLDALGETPDWFNKDVPVVGALSKGWGNVWNNLKDQFEDDTTSEGKKKVNIKFETRITQIIRDKVK
mmetsp:Transcript_23864/g.31675  ORF Transcript_23864/g.31675 Transcript_23864/m.31675 type:complete len:617 (+) Transcript_23864:311-2161(+)